MKQNRNPNTNNKGSQGQKFNAAQGRRVGQQNNAGKQNRQKSDQHAMDDDLE